MFIIKMAEVHKCGRGYWHRSESFLRLPRIETDRTEPTRKEHLLDIALTDIQKSTASVTSYIADHKGVLIKVAMPKLFELRVQRELWCLTKANWKHLREELKAYDWQMLGRGKAEDALGYFMEVLWNHLEKHIPRRILEAKKSIHPWLNTRCMKAILRKNTSEGSAHFERETALIA